MIGCYQKFTNLPQCLKFNVFSGNWTKNLILFQQIETHGGIYQSLCRAKVQEGQFQLEVAVAVSGILGLGTSSKTTPSELESAVTGPI